MAKVNAPVFALNGGEIGPEGLGRLDLERLQFAGSLYKNVLPRVVGAMTFRPGLEHIQNIDLGDVMLLEWSYSGTTSIVGVLSDEALRIVVDGEFVTRASVSTAITNGDFSSFTGWTDASTGTATATVSGGQLLLTGAPFRKASATQTITVAGGDQNVEHGLRINVANGPVSVRLGSSSGASDLLPGGATAILQDGDHSIAFTPTGASVYLELFHEEDRALNVESCTIDAAGVLVLTTPWTDTDLAAEMIRYVQHKDVMYIASGTYQQREIQRRGDTSWGIQRYKVTDGPFTAYDGAVSISPSTSRGNGTLDSNAPIFESGMENRLFRIFTSGQTVEENFDAAGQEGDTVRVSGVGVARKIRHILSGTWSATIDLQVAIDDGSGTPTGWTTLASYTTNHDVNYTDPDDNVIKYFRFVCSAYTSGTANAVIAYSGGSQSGVCRILAVNSTINCSIEILDRFYSTNYSTQWDYSTWSDYDGWPSAVEQFGGRLYWGKADTIHGSVPDSFFSFDDQVEGDSAPISRSIGAKTTRGILWLLGLSRLIAGVDTAEISIKSSSFDDPLTNSAWLPTETSNRGCANIRAVKVDQAGIFVQSTGDGVFALTTAEGTLEYRSSDLLEMHEKICGSASIVDIAVQRRPDTVVWFILSNGEARALTYEPLQRIIAWSRVITDGYFKRVAASRGAGQDNVYFAVERDSSLRLEKLADLDDCIGGSKNCLADGFTYFSVSSPTTTFSVPHLDGLDVTVWVNGVAIHDQDDLYTVASNQVVLASSVASGDVVIGLPYLGDYKSTKLAYGAQGGTALFQKKKVSQLGLYLLNTAPSKLKAGKDFDTLRPVSLRAPSGRVLTAGEVLDEYDADMLPISSDWNSDSRVCLRMFSPYPATAACMVLDIDTNG